MQRAAQVDQAALGQLICLNGMLSDPNTPGTEKLTATHAQSSWLSSPVTRFVTGSKHKGIRGTGLAMPQEVFMVKGWNRSASLMMVLYAAYDSSEFYKVRCCSVFVCVFAKQLCFRRPSRLKWQRVSLSHKKISHCCPNSNSNSIAQVIPDHPHHQPEPATVRDRECEQRLPKHRELVAAALH